MDKLETKFLNTNEKAPLLWFKYMDYIFFIRTHGKEHLETLLQELNNFNPDLKFTYELNEKKFPILDLKVKLNERKIWTDINIYILHHHTLIILRGQ